MTCTRIIVIQDRKPKTFKGEKGKCLALSVEKYPDTKAYFEFVSGRSRVGDVKHRYHADHRIRIDSSLPEGDAPKSKPSAFELILAGNYESDEQFKAKLLEAISKGCGLEPDRD